MNENHARLCSKPEWAAHLQSDILPLLVREVDLGSTMLEVGPGPGAATAWLRSRVARLVVIESDAQAVDLLSHTYEGTNVEVVAGDATATAFGDASFDSAGSFTMLHHLATVCLQNLLLGELLRVLRPGGVVIGSDSLPSDKLHRFHDADTYNPVEPGTFLTRLQTLGFEKITISVDTVMRFTAYKPEAG